MSASSPSPAYRAFSRLLKLYPKGDQDRIIQAMSILEITPDDKVWLAVVVAVDLIDALARRSEAIPAKLAESVDGRIDRLGTIAASILDDAGTVTSAADRAVAEARNVAAVINEASATLAAQVSSTGTEVGAKVSREIASTYSDQLKATIAQRNRLSQIALIAGILAAASIGASCGWVLHGSEVQQVVAACRIGGHAK